MPQGSDRLTTAIRWIARVVCSLVAMFWLFVGAVSAINDPQSLSWESWVMAGLILSSALATALAWWRDGLGGALVVAVGIAHSTFALAVSGHNRGFAMLISGGPFVITGTLFLVAWWRMRRARATP